MAESPELKRLIKTLLHYKVRDNGADRAVWAAQAMTRKMQPGDPRPGWVDALANAHLGYEVEACQEAYGYLKEWLNAKDLAGKYGNEGGE